MSYYCSRRFANAQEGIRRFGVSTSNWAESQNNAIMKQRNGSIMYSLQKNVTYTLVQKLTAYKNYSANLLGKPLGTCTEYAMEILNTNRMMTVNCLIEENSSTDCETWVEEYGRQYIVKINPNKQITCSCHRFFDEGIPCQHIIKVNDFKRIHIESAKLIDSTVLQFSLWPCFYSTKCEGIIHCKPECCSSHCETKK